MPHPTRWWRFAALAVALWASDALAINGAAFVSQVVPQEITASASYSVAVTYRNTGTTPWTEIAGHRLGSQNPQDGQTWGLGRVVLPAGEVVPSGGSKTFSFVISAPPTAGVYDFQWRLLQEGVEWFGDATPNLRITVRPAIPSGLSPAGDVSLPATTTTATLSWGSAAGAVSYAVRVKDLTDTQARDPRSNCPDVPAIFACLNGVPGTALDISVTPGHSYEWWLHAQGADGSLSNFSSAFFSISSPAPFPPVLLSPTGPQANGTQSVTLTWAASLGADRYAVRVEDEDDGSLVHPGNNCTGAYVCVNDLSALSLAVAVTAGHSYRWWVHAGNSAGYGTYAEASFSVPSGPSGSCEPPRPGQNDSDWMNQKFIEGAPGYELKLCPLMQYRLDKRVFINKTNQALVTEGEHRALLKLLDAVPPAAQETTAVDAYGVTGARLQNVDVDGGRRGSSRIEKEDALLKFGGSASGQSVIGVHAQDPRSWSLLHFGEGSKPDPQNPGAVIPCSDGLIEDNTFWNIGRGFPEWDQWADGISMACSSTRVLDNIIENATDGAIVVFCAPGSTISGNTIRAVDRTLLGGINMVDFPQYAGDYTGVVVSDNTIVAETAHVMTGIAMGHGAWMFQDPKTSCTHKINKNAFVFQNVLQGPFMGYGFVTAGVSDWDVLGNSSTATHSGKVYSAECGPSEAPASFVADPEDTDAASSLQPEFVFGPINKIIPNLSPPTPIALSPNGTTFDGTTTTVPLSWDAACLRPDPNGNGCLGRPSVVLRVRKDGVLSLEQELDGNPTQYSLAVEPGHAYTWTVAACYGPGRYHEGSEQDQPASFSVAPAPAQVNAARIVSVSTPLVMLRGVSYGVSVTVENAGTTTWTKALGYKLGSQNPQDNQTWGFGRVELSAADSIPPGGQKVFTFLVQAPSVIGYYDFQWRMLREMVEWFGDATENKRIRVR